MTISLRNLPPEIELAILEKSRKDGISLNKAATQLLSLAVTPADKTGIRNNQFDEFFGTWSAEEAAEFDQALASMRSIDPNEWKPLDQ